MTTDEQCRYIFDRVAELLGEAKALVWMTVPNPELGYLIPLDLIAAGNFEPLRSFVDARYEDWKRCEKEIDKARVPR